VHRAKAEENLRKIEAKITAEKQRAQRRPEERAFARLETKAPASG
jgi:hypothetical protein